LFLALKSNLVAVVVIVGVAVVVPVVVDDRVVTLVSPSIFWSLNVLRVVDTAFTTLAPVVEVVVLVASKSYKFVAFHGSESTTPRVRFKVLLEPLNSIL